MLPLPDLKSKRCLILGATGFLGRWLCRTAERAGALVQMQARSAADLEALRAPYDLRSEALIFDLLEIGALEAALQGQDFDLVINAAGYGVDRTERNEALAEALNADLPERIGRAVCDGKTRFVQLGSALEYGDVGGSLAEDGPTQATTLYGRTKLAGTKAICCLRAERGLSGLTARLFSVYGPGEHEGRLLPTLVAAAKRKGDIDLSMGLQERDFGQVEEVARAVLHLAATAKLAEDIVNVASGHFRAVRDFCLEAAEVWGLDGARLRFGALPTRPEEMSHEPVATTRLRKAIGGVLELDLRAGLERSREFIEETVRD